MLDSQGTIERGKLAELVLLDANPLDDIGKTTKINTVFTGGRMYPRKALDGVLSAVEANARKLTMLRVVQSGLLTGASQTGE